VFCLTQGGRCEKTHTLINTKDKLQFPPEQSRSSDGSWHNPNLYSPTILESIWYFIARDASGRKRSSTRKGTLEFTIEQWPKVSQDGAAYGKLTVKERQKALEKMTHGDRMLALSSLTEKERAEWGGTKLPAFYPGLRFVLPTSFATNPNPNPNWRSVLSTSFAAADMFTQKVPNYADQLLSLITMSSSPKSSNQAGLDDEDIHYPNLNGRYLARWDKKSSKAATVDAASKKHVERNVLMRLMSGLKQYGRERRHRFGPLTLPVYRHRIIDA